MIKLRAKKPKKIMTMYQSESIKSLCPMLSRYDNQGLMIDRMFSNKKVTWDRYLNDLCYQILGFKIIRVHRDLLKSELRQYGVNLMFPKVRKTQSQNGKVIHIRS